MASTGKKEVWSFDTKKKTKEKTQRAENGALDPWSLDLRLGRPRFWPPIAAKLLKISDLD